VPATADTTAVRASIEPSLIGLGETATFTIEVRGTGLASQHFRPNFELDNLEIVGGPNQFQDMSLSNGTLTRTFRLSWRLRPLGVGKAGVRALSLELDGDVIRMRDREITVQEAPTGQAEPEEEEDPFERLFGGPLFQRRPQASRGPAVFLRAEAQPQRPWAGQQVLYTVYLYTHDDITSMAAREMPTFRGFWVRDVPLPQHLPTEMVEMNGERYARVPVLQKALFPLRPGRYTIDPASMDVIARVVEQRFFGPPFAHPEQVQVRTPAVAVDVQPLPPAPLGFGGAVGQLALSARVEPAQLRVGEAATLTVTLAGRGNVQGVGEPRIALPPGLEIFPPQQQGDERIVGTTVQGSRTWSWVIVPQSSGRTTLRVPQVPFFDPQSGQYRVASAAPLEITTLPPAAAAIPDTSDSMLRSLGDGEPRGRTGISGQRALPWLLALTFALAAAAALARRRRPVAVSGPSPARASSTSTARAESGAALGEITRRLDEAAAETRPRQAAARIEEAWRDFLVERWDIAPGTPSPRWGEALRNQGADPAAAGDLARLADDLHYLRYAPQLSACETLCGEVLATSRRLLRRLR
jgi:hypothetical protein